LTNPSARTEKKGRTRECRLGSEQMDEATKWIEMYRRQREHRLDRLQAFIVSKKGDGK
jgi:hypothetical protein